MLDPLAEGAASMLLSHSEHFSVLKTLGGRRAWYSKCITHSGVQQWCRKTSPPVEPRQTLCLYCPLSSISRPHHSLCLSSDADLCCPCLPMKNQTRSSAATWNPTVMRWWQTQVLPLFPKFKPLDFSFVKKRDWFLKNYASPFPVLWSLLT